MITQEPPMLTDAQLQTALLQQWMRDQGVACHVDGDFGAQSKAAAETLLAGDSGIEPAEVAAKLMEASKVPEGIEIAAKFERETAVS